MKLSIITFYLLSITGVLGMVLEISGMYLAIKMKEKDNKSACKFFYKIMTLGEIFMSLCFLFVVMFPVIAIIEIINKFI